LLDLLHANEALLADLPDTTSLIHCDYNAKNILVENDRVAGVLDWEFAESGSGLVDVGNFLRFEDELPADFVHGFVEGYSSARALPTSFRKIAHLLDLASMCSFLTSESERPNTFRTARTVIDRTLAAYGFAPARIG